MFRSPEPIEQRSLPDYTKKIIDANNMDTVANFWQIGEFKRMVNRLDAGATLLDDFSRMVLERAHIEKKYAQMLSSWSKKWGDKIAKGPEENEGTLKPAWKGLLTEADELSEIHARTDTQLRETVQQEVAKRKKETFTRQLRGWRVSKDAHDRFAKAEKPWAKRLKASKKAKKAYYSACETRDALEAKLRIVRSDVTVPDEERAKMEAKVDKAIATANDTRALYQDSIQQLQDDKARFEAEMKEAYNFCEDVEQKRQDFFKEMMTKYHAILSQHTPDQCQAMLKEIEGINPDADLVRFRRQKGTDMPLCVPSFQDYGSKPTIEIVVDQTITEHLPVGTTDLQAESTSDDEDDDNDDDDDTEEDEQEWEPREPLPPSNPEVGRPVRAIYDYGAEDDEEITVAAGDGIRLIEEEDEQGWCKGITVDGAVGLFPACYVEDITEEEYRAIKEGTAAEC